MEAKVISKRDGFFTIAVFLFLFHLITPMVVAIEGSNIVCVEKINAMTEPTIFPIVKYLRKEKLITGRVETSSYGGEVYEK